MIRNCKKIKRQLKTYSLRSKEEHTTETDEAAIAADAIHGLNDRPTGVNTPVANNETL